jgi:hypothetical protein
MGDTMAPTFDVETWRAHAKLTRKLVEQARREGNLALARELADVAREAERHVAAAEELVVA